MWLKINPGTQSQMQGENSKNRTISKVKSHIMSIVKVQSVTPILGLLDVFNKWVVLSKNFSVLNILPVRVQYGNRNYTNCFSRKKLNNYFLLSFSL